MVCLTNHLDLYELMICWGSYQLCNQTETTKILCLMDVPLKVNLTCEGISTIIGQRLQR